MSKAMSGIPIYKNKSLKDIKGEVWKEIPFTEGYYMVSNLGRVKALERFIYTDASPYGRRLKERILSQSMSRQRNSYTKDETFGLMVTYTFEGTRMHAMVRRLVYEMFVAAKTKEKMDGKLVYPLDGNGLNSKADNLALGTRTELRIKQLKKNRYQPPFHLLPLDYYHKLAIKAGKSRRKKVCKYKPDGT